jgi:hypothetical protein
LQPKLAGGCCWLSQLTSVKNDIIQPPKRPSSGFFQPPKIAAPKFLLFRSVVPITTIPFRRWKMDWSIGFNHQL